MIGIMLLNVVTKMPFIFSWNYSIPLILQHIALTLACNFPTKEQKPVLRCEFINPLNNYGIKLGKFSFNKKKPWYRFRPQLKSHCYKASSWFQK